MPIAMSVLRDLSRQATFMSRLPPTPPTEVAPSEKVTDSKERSSERLNVSAAQMSS